MNAVGAPVAEATSWEARTDQALPLLTDPLVRPLPAEVVLQLAIPLTGAAPAPVLTQNAVPLAG